jgi:hypothetical protein
MNYLIGYYTDATEKFHKPRTLKSQSSCCTPPPPSPAIFQLFSYISSYCVMTTQTVAMILSDNLF